MTSAETVYIDGEVWTRDEAEKHLGFLVRQMDALGQAGAHQGRDCENSYVVLFGRDGLVTQSLEERFDELKREAMKIERALSL